MINVLHLRDTDRVCGPGKTIIETACLTDRREFSQKIGLFMLDRESLNLYGETAERRGVEVIPIRSGHQLDPRIISALATVIADHRIDIVHSHEYKSDLLAFAVSRLRPIPIMTTIHGWITHSLKRRLMIGLSQRAIRQFDRVVAVSDETRRRILACGVDPARVLTIHNAIVTENYRASDQSPGFLRSRFKLPADAMIVGSIGRLSREKGQGDLIDAAATLTREFPALFFVFVGDGPDRAALEARAAALAVADRVLFTGFLKDVRPVYRDLDILALTSYTEGFPNVVLEALCMGRPVLATDVGGTSEVIENGRTGVLVAPHAPIEIAAGLRALLRDPEWAVGLTAAGAALVHERFSFADRVRREEDVYRQLIDEWQERRGTRAAGRVQSPHEQRSY